MKGFGSVLTIWGLSLLILAMFFVMFQVKAEGISFYILVLVILVALGIIDIHAWKIFRTMHAKKNDLNRIYNIGKKDIETCYKDLVKYLK